MRLLWVLGILLMIWPIGPVSARIYRYTDKNGVVHYTDNLSNIPEDLRPDADDEKQPPPPQPRAKEGTPEGKDEALKPEESPDKAQKETQDQPGEEKRPAFAEEMNKEKAALDAEHARLMERKKALMAERETLKTPEEVRAYQRKVVQLNSEIEAYDKKNRAFKKKVDAYNKAMKEGREK